MRPLSDFDTSWLDPNYISHWAASNAEQAKEMSCLTDANMSSAVSALDAQTLNLAKTWNPTGFYSAADVNKLYTTVSTLIAQARIPLATAPFTTSDSDMVVKQAGHDLDRALTKGQAYLDAMQQAQARGLATIDAPGMKMWVLNSLNAVSSAYVTVAALQCRKTWLDTAAGWIASAIAAIKSVIGVILKAGELALKVAGDTLDFVAMVSKYLPWAALGVAAYWVYTKASTWQRS
jgi:hypothetical protein